MKVLQYIRRPILFGMILTVHPPPAEAGIYMGARSTVGAPESVLERGDYSSGGSGGGLSYYGAPASGGGVRERFPKASKRVEDHLKVILEEFPNKKQYGKEVANKVQQDARSKDWKTDTGTAKGSKLHPWQENGNPNTEDDHIIDSLVVTDDTANLNELWSCFEPRRIGGYLDEICDQMCPDWCGATYYGEENRHEVIEYWLPEHQVDTNDYAIPRVEPAQMSQKGRRFTRQALLAQKKQSEQEEIQLASQKKADDAGKASKYKSPDEMKGHGVNEGLMFSGFDYTQKLYAHGVRSRYSYQVAEIAPNSSLGWKEEPRCMADSFPPKKEQKDILHLWTEYGITDVLWNMPEISDKRLSQREKDMYKATTPPDEPIDQAAKNGKEWLKKKSPAAYRQKNFPGRYRELEELGFEGENDQKQGEAVFWNTTFGPVTGLTDGSLGLPPLSAGAIVSRIAMHAMGAKIFVQKNYHPDGEKGRMNEYTVLESDKRREIDKMQRIWPRDGLKPSECFRSQKIPNMTDSTQDQWAKKNMPHDMVKYVNEHFGAQAYMGWNKRVSCTCKYCSWPFLKGCQLMNLTPGMGDGDRPYGKFENVVCKYRQGLFPSAFAGTDVQCIPDGKKYEGIEDDPNELKSKP